MTDYPMVLSRRSAVGTIAYLGGFMSPPDPFVWSFIQMAVFSQESLCTPGQFVHVDRSRYGLHDFARNDLVQRFLGDWILFCDADHQFEPDLCTRMVMLMNRHGVDVLTGMYANKTRPENPILYMFNEKTEAHEVVTDWDHSLDLFEVHSAGGGCLLVRRRVFEEIVFKLNENPFDRIGRIGEDHSFFARLRKLKIPAYCAWKVQPGHLKFQAVHPDLEMTQQQAERLATHEWPVHGMRQDELWTEGVEIFEERS